MKTLKSSTAVPVSSFPHLLAPTVKLRIEEWGLTSRFQCSNLDYNTFELEFFVMVSYHTTLNPRGMEKTRVLHRKLVMLGKQIFGFLFVLFSRPLTKEPSIGKKRFS